jgi:hypothetical protein
MTMSPQLSRSSEPLPRLALPLSPALRRLASSVLHSASAGLARTAARLETPYPAPRPAAAQCVEFHAEAGALEGALYVDGRLVALLPGVKRL